MYEAERAWCIADLAIQAVDLHWHITHRKFVRKQPGGVGGKGTVGQAQLIVPGCWNVWLATDDVNYGEVVDTIFHELRHVWQWETGTIDDDAHLIVWKGTTFAPGRTWTSKGAYKFAPYEVDARKYAADAVQRYLAGRVRPKLVTPTDYLGDMFL